ACVSWSRPAHRSPPSRPSGWSPAVSSKPPGCMRGWWPRSIRPGSSRRERTYSEPHWVANRGFVAAYESVSLYGLSLATRRRVNYGPVAPGEAREIFIREALIAPAAGGGQPMVRGGFLDANRGLRAQIECLEAK